MPTMDTTHDLLALKRRGVGKGAWKVTLHELIESERMCLQHVRALRNRYADDSVAQGYLTDLALEAAERLAKLHELLNYRERESHACPDTGGNGSCP